MRSVNLATLVAAVGIFPAAAFGQLSITNYQFVSEQKVTLTSSAVTYRADLVNPGNAVAGVTATVTTLDPFSVRIIPGKDTLQFAPVPANSQVAGNNTFTILVDRTRAFNFNKLNWNFQINPLPPPVANAGPNQMAAIGSTVTLDGSGSTNPSGIGTLSYSFAFTSRPAGSAAFLQRSTTPMPSFVVDVPGSYVVLLTVSNGVASSTASVTVSISCAAPVANAGPDQSVAPGTAVVLNGGGSTSACGTPLTYAWTLIAFPIGSTATLTGANTASPAFVVDKAGMYKAQLIVNDGVNNSAPSIVTITQVVKPVANAGPAQVVNVGVVVQLNGAGSTDANGLPLIYQWSFNTLPPGSSAAIGNPAAVNPTFTADRPGTYVAQLIVKNAVLSSDPATVVITTQPAMQPTANAGPNQTVNVGSTVTLNGSGTDPQNLPLTFQWALINKPAGSAASLSSGTLANPSFAADLAGAYIAQLVVSNGFSSSAPVTVTISTTCSQPTANPGPNQNVAANSIVTLNGSGSGDACHDALTYAFSFTARPSGSNAILSGATTVSPTFVADVGGVYVVQLIVNNGFSNSTPATVTITAAYDIVLPANVRVLQGQTLDFPVTLTNPAPSGGVFITLTGSDASKVSLSLTSLFIPAGATAPNRPPTVTGLENGSSLITASAVGLAPANQVVTVGGTGPGLSFSGSPLALVVGGTGDLTLNLSAAAPAGGLTITLTSSNPAAATVPATVTFAMGAASVPVTVTGVGAGSTTISASGPGTGASATANVSQISILVPSTLKVSSGQSVAFTVSLSQPAPAGGVTVSLSSSDSSKIAVSPASVFIAAGSTTPATQPSVTGSFGSATITASVPGYISGSGTVSGSQSTLTFTGSPLSVNVGGTGSLTLNLNGNPVPAGGFTVNLTSSDPSKAAVPATVIIPAGATTVPVTVTGIAVGSPTITASAPGVSSATTNVTVVSLSLGVPAGTSVNLGAAASFAVTLSQPAPVGGVTVTLSSGDTSKVTVSPTSVFIAAGATTPATQPQVAAVGIGSAAITASALGYTSGTGTVTVPAPALNFTGSPLSLTAGSTGTLTLNLTGGQAPAGGLTVTLSSGDSTKATVAGSVSIPAGATSAPVSVTGVAMGGPVTITASAPGIVANATASVTVVSLSIAVPAGTPVNLGSSAIFVIALSQPAPVGGVTVNLGSSNTGKVTVSPATVSILAGATTPATQPQVTATGIGSATITASATGYTSGSGTVTVGAPALSFTSASLSISGNSGTLTLNLTGGQAPLGGFSVALSSSNPAVATVPVTVVIPAGSSSAPVTVTALKGGTTTITASAVGVPSTSAVVTVSAAVGMTITIDSASVGQNLQVPILLAISPVAPSSGLTLTVTSSDPGKVLVASHPGELGNPQVAVAIGQGLALQRIYAQGLTAGGTVTLTVSAPGYQSSQSTITLTPSGFVMSAPGSASSFTTSVGAVSPTNLTLNAARLDSSFNFAEIQQVRGGFPTSVTILNSNPSAGTVASPVLFGGGEDTAAAAFTPTNNNANQGTTTLTAIAPAGFSTPATGTGVTATVSSFPTTCTAARVGKSLQTTVQCVIQGGSATTAGLQVTFTSADSSKLQFAPLPANATACTAAGSGSIVLTTVAPPLGAPIIPVFCAYGLAGSGVVTYSINAPGLLPSTGTVTLGPSGVVISGPGGVGQNTFVVFNSDTNISVYSALLDGAGNYVTAQPVAGGSSATVNVTSSNTALGTIATSPLTIAGGSIGATTVFHQQPGANGNTDLIVSPAPGFDIPAAAFTKVTARVFFQSPLMACGTVIGKDLQETCTISMATAAASPISFTLTSANSGLLLLSSSATAAGSGIATVTVPAGSTTATFYAQALGSSGTVTIKASAPGSGIPDSGDMPITLAPSGAVFSGLPFLFASAGGPAVPITVALSVLNSDNSSGANFQPLRGGLAPVQVLLNSGNPGVGSITSPLTISAGTSSATAQFTPLSSGTTIVSVLPAAGFSTASTRTTLTASVSP